MKFAKMHGAGNDFIMINDMNEALEISAGLVSALCARHFGIGADGIVLIRPSGKFDFSMVYFNSDGSRAEMCGNGARCAARFAVTEGIAGPSHSFRSDSAVVEADVGESSVEISIEDVKEVRLGMETGGFNISYAVAGVPHAVIFSDRNDISLSDDFVSIARKIRYSEIFEPEGANVNLATVISEKSLSYRTYERGVEDETMACGTGAVAISVLGSHLGILSSPVSCQSAGGDLLGVRFKKESYGASSIYLRGPAIETFRGEADISEFVKD